MIKLFAYTEGELRKWDHVVFVVDPDETPQKGFLAVVRCHPTTNVVDHVEVIPEGGGLKSISGALAVWRQVLKPVPGCDCFRCARTSEGSA